MLASITVGLAVTALHNHFFYDEPKVYFMHIGGEGTAAPLSSILPPPPNEGSAAEPSYSGACSS